MEDAASKILGWALALALEATIVSSVIGKIWWFVPHNYMGKPDTEVVQALRMPALILLGLQAIVFVWWLRTK